MNATQIKLLTSWINVKIDIRKIKCYLITCKYLYHKYQWIEISMNKMLIIDIINKMQIMSS